MSNALKRLDDAALQRFIRDGYSVLHPEFADGYHEGIYQQIETGV